MFKSKFKFKFSFPKPNTNSYKILLGVCSVVVTVFSVYLFVWAGNIDSPGVPASAGRMYTLEQIYQRTNTGTAATKDVSFNVPGAPPASTMHTLDNVYSGFDTDATSCNGTTAADVRSGKTFFATSGTARGTSWGPVTGTMPPGAMVATGQTTSYKANDDGAYKTGLALSYTNGIAGTTDGTITDNNTKLMWVKQPELIIPGTSVIASNQIQVAHGNWVTSHPYVVGDLVSSAGGDAAPFYVCIVAHTSGTFATDLAAGKWILTIWTTTAANLTSPKTMVWDSTQGSPDALSACDNLTYAGYDNWRLPNVKELQSIVDYGQVSPAVHKTGGVPDFFINAQSGNYWSSTTYAVYSGIAWYVYFSSGSVGYDYKDSPNQVRCVR